MLVDIIMLIKGKLVYTPYLIFFQVCYQSKVLKLILKVMCGMIEVL